MALTRVRGNNFRCECGAAARVKDSRPMQWKGLAVIRRRRRCQGCGARFNTYEIADAALTALGLVDHGAVALAGREVEQALHRLLALAGSR